MVNYGKLCHYVLYLFHSLLFLYYPLIFWMGIPLLAAPLDAGVLHPFHGQLLLCDHPRTKVFKGDLDHSWNHRVLMGLNGLQKKCSPLLLRKKLGKRNDQRDDGT